MLPATAGAVAATISMCWVQSFFDSRDSLIRFSKVGGAILQLLQLLEKNPAQ
jgi:uncharacterized membrane protein